MTKDSVGFQLVKILRLKRCFIDLEMKKLELSRTQWRVLFWMRILGPCSQKELLNNLEIDAAHLARVLSEFEQNNVITRTPVKGNRRSLFIQLTDYCKKKLMPQMENTLEKENALLHKGLNAQDKKHLERLLSKLETNLESELKSKKTWKNLNDE